MNFNIFIILSELGECLSLAFLYLFLNLTELGDFLSNVIGLGVTKAEYNSSFSGVR